MSGCGFRVVAVVLLAWAALAHAGVSLAAEALAFPGAEGAGRYSLGGRKGAVLKVTNLNDSGPGSLRAAIGAQGPRIIVFDVSGTIALESPLRIRNPRVTIAGQSAPGGGITLKNYPLVVGADDVVIRYIRSRLGDERRTENDAVWIYRGWRIILDHVSASWSVDETLSANNSYTVKGSGFNDLTVQWSIIAESLNQSVHEKGPHGYGSLVAGAYGARISFHHNLWAHHAGRSPRPGNPVTHEKDPIGSLHEYRSNVFYNWGGEHAGYNADKGKKASVVKYNFIDNTYIRGPQSTGGIAFDESNALAKAWFSGNTMDGVLPANQWILVTGNSDASYRLPKPLDVAPVIRDPASSAYERVLDHAGASLARDAVDARVVRSVRERNGRIIDSQKQVGGWPELTSKPALMDTDSDGMPDAWERVYGFDPERADDKGDPDGDGYTNIEQYLNGLVAPRRIEVDPKKGLYRTLQSAVNALSDQGGEILLAPGEYREKVTINKYGVQLKGQGKQPQDVVIVWGDANATVGGTIKSATLSASADDFKAENLTIQNDYSLKFKEPSQAVALAVTGDRAVFERVRLLGAQDTLYAANRKCAAEPCPPTSRQYFRDCYIEGHVDFIFGDSKAFFDRCQIHGIEHAEIMITAHARTAPDQDRAFVFDRCQITADAKAGNIYFGRPWRDYAAVIFMNTRIDAPLHPEGWREWTPGQTKRLRTAYYAEFRSIGLGANKAKRQVYAVPLTLASAQKWARDVFLAGKDSWRPELTSE